MAGYFRIGAGPSCLYRPKARREIMMESELFEWDDTKAQQNANKHQVTFADATTVFDDPEMTDDLDDTMDYGESRYLAVGIADGRLLSVVYTMRGARIRVISARSATQSERRKYGDQRKR
jgi:uncharacterized protein